MKKIFVLLLFIALTKLVFSQPLDVSQRGFYSVQQVMNARANAEMNRHYESLKPTTSSPSRWGNINAGADFKLPYSGADFRQNQIAAGERLAAIESVWNSKEKKMINLIRDRKIGKTASSYPDFMQAAKEAFYDDYIIGRMFPSSATQYESVVKDQNSAFYKKWFYYENVEIEKKEAQKRQEQSRKYDEEIKKAIEVQRAEKKRAFNAEFDRMISKVEEHKAGYLNQNRTLVERKRSLVNMIEALKDINRDLLYSNKEEDKASVDHLYYYLALLEIQLGENNVAMYRLYGDVLKVCNQSIVPTFANCYHKIIYNRILMQADASSIQDLFKEAEKRANRKLFFWELPYAQFLSGNNKDAIETLEQFSKKNEVEKKNYQFCIAALLIINSDEKAALKFANKNLGNFADAENLKLVLVDTLWKQAIEAKFEEGLVPMAALFKIDMLKKLEPTSLSIAQASLGLKNAAVWHTAAIADNELVKKLGGNSNLNNTTTTKIANEDAALKKKIAEQREKQDALNKKQFIDEAITSYTFTNWQTAIQKFKWDNVEVNNAKLVRNLKDNKVNYSQTETSTLLANYKTNNDKDWAFSVEFTLNRAANYAAQGIYLKTKGGKNTKHKKAGKDVLFVMDPITDSYIFKYAYKSDYAIADNYFGEYEYNCSWETLASSSTQYETPNPGVLYCGVDAVTNVLSLKKIDNKIELYINYKFIKTISINEDEDFLHNITNIGIVAFNEQEGSINKILFIEEPNKGNGERPIDELWKEVDPNTPPKKTVADFEKDIFYLLNLVKTTDVTNLRGGIDINTKTFDCGINFNYPSKGSVYGDLPKGTKAFQNACVTHFEKMMNEYAIKNGWSVKKTEEEVTKKEKKERDWKCTKRYWIFCYDEKGKTRIILRYCDNDNPRDDHYDLTVYDPNRN